MALPKIGDDVSIIDESWNLDLGNSIKFEGQNFIFNSPVEVNAAVKWLDNELLSVEIAVKLDIEAECARCLKPVRLAISEKLMYLYYLRGLEVNDDTGFKNFENFMPVELEYFSRTLDIAPQVWETILLLLPTKVLCKEDCAGLCPICGADLNENPCSCKEDTGDPRLSALKDFKV